MKKIESLRKNRKGAQNPRNKIKTQGGKEWRINPKTQGQRGTCVFLTTQIFNIFTIFFNINTNINIKIPKKFNINIKINILEMQISISISKSIFWNCSFQYQNQYQYVQNFDFSKIFKILCHVWCKHLNFSCLVGIKWGWLPQSDWSIKYYVHT